VAAFTFSRLPREQRIAQTLFTVLSSRGLTSDLYSKPEDLIEAAKELAEYSVKDFAVRYGHLKDGAA
jgi:hypothetical protein